MISLIRNEYKRGVMVTILTGLCCAVFFLPALNGCAAQKGSFGLVMESRDIDRQFKDGAEFPADYQWYYTGSPGSPRVLMGISPKYKLDTDLWKPVDTAETPVSSMVTLMNNNYGQYKFTTFGSRIDGPQGERIGVWYSPIRRTTVAVKEDGTLKIAIPKQNKGKRMVNI
jgi:hypothetical protein